MAPFPDLCLLVPFLTSQKNRLQNTKQLEPQQKYRLGTIGNIKLLGGGGGLNRFYRRLTSLSSSAVIHNICPTIEITGPRIQVNDTVSFQFCILAVSRLIVRFSSVFVSGKSYFFCSHIIHLASIPVNHVRLTCVFLV